MEKEAGRERVHFVSECVNRSGLSMCFLETVESR